MNIKLRVVVCVSSRNRNMYRDCVKRKKPVWSVSAEFLLINKSRQKLYVTPATFNFLFKPYRILEDQCSVLVTELRYLCRYCKMFGIARCLNSCNFRKSFIRPKLYFL